MKKTAIVTGGSRGIGYGIAKQLGEDGYNIAILDINDPQKYQENLDALTNAGVDWYYQQGSITNKEDRERFVAAVVERYGDIDVLVNNAGVAPKIRNDILEMTEESFDYVVGTNTKGTMFMTQLVARQMLTQEVKGRRRGVIVNISSSSVAVSSVSRGEYCISKAGVAMITMLFADRLAAHDIQVYEIRPGVIETDMTSVVHKKYSDLIEQGVFPIARWGQPEDIAGAVSAFCSDKFLYSTGNYIDLDGGFHIRKL
ncbi:MAG: 3-ketoacyl-ACP reductase [Clostridiales bacterium]|nr:3-ketoacyl-ACP reductase [Clostridiales bacterium]MDO4350239.1 3-ketoacyl-ACP reductase [Eubacteriales bacterium]MDY4009805.1 3-ketoacyl-ACP reductase [Candidatus Limiplasma sp.]